PGTASTAANGGPRGSSATDIARQASRTEDVAPIRTDDDEAQGGRQDRARVHFVRARHARHDLGQEEDRIDVAFLAEWKVCIPRLIAGRSIGCNPSKTL